MTWRPLGYSGYRPAAVTVRLAGRSGLTGFGNPLMMNSFRAGPLGPSIGEKWTTVPFTPEIERALESGALELQPEPIASPPSKPAKRKGGRKPSAFWAKVELHFTPLIADGGPYPSLGSLRDAITGFLGTQAPSGRTIERWVNDHHPDWFKYGGT
jgi:hypothetical protein